MPITIGLFGGDESRRPTIHAHVARPPALDSYSSGQLIMLEVIPTLPAVVLLAVPEIRCRGSDSIFYRQLARAHAAGDSGREP